MYLETRKRNIRILGAGISGLVAGITLAKSGLKVKVFEKRSRVGSFFEKNIHSFRNYIYDYDVIEKYKQIGIEIPHTYPIFKEFRFSPSLKCVEIYSKSKPLFYNFFRGYKDEKSLDVELYKLAKKNGVKFYFNQNLNNTEVDIIATGARTVKGIAYVEHYKVCSEIAPNSIYMFLNNDYSPRGYTYILPFNNEVSVGIASTKKESRSDFKKRFNNFKNNNPIIKKNLQNAKFENENFGFAFYDLPKTAMENGKLYVGEAAGFLDAVSGFGTHYAILSGYLAAKAIIENKNYDNLWQEAFGDELKIQYLRRNKLEKFTNRDYEKTIENLIRNYGNKISAREYKLHKLSTWKLKKI